MWSPIEILLSKMGKRKHAVVSRKTAYSDGDGSPIQDMVLSILKNTPGWYVDANGLLRNLQTHLDLIKPVTPSGAPVISAAITTAARVALISAGEWGYVLGIREVDGAGGDILLLNADAIPAAGNTLYQATFVASQNSGGPWTFPIYGPLWAVAGGAGPTFRISTQLWSVRA